jgi:RNA-directed DNA polymerase
MLAALARGLEANRWFSLIDKIYADKTLGLAWEKVKANAGGSGVDDMTIARYEKDCHARLLDVKERLVQSRYQPKPVKRMWIPKAGTSEKRPLGIPTVEDRIVQTAIRIVIEPIFERDFSESSHGFRPGRSCKNALREVERHLNNGHHHVVDADIKGYFDAIPKERLMRLVETKIADGRVLALLRQYLDQGVMDNGQEQPAGQNGTPQGAVLSPLLANIYLDPFDQHMDKRGARLVRYADDFVVLCRSEAEARATLEEVRAWMEANGLTLHPTKTRTVDASQPGGFDFLGYHFERGRKWPSKKAHDKFKDKIRELTPRTSGASLANTIEKTNKYLRGWYEYFKHCRARLLEEYDRYIRGRLRSILRKRAGKQGRARGADHQRWSNRYFTEAGLFSLAQAHAEECRSCR